ncbi:MAG: glycoside hydrolase family 78 protein [Oscillospiraceae bacterium]|jgi:alpha-L-rhamnosidase|nr:glycoside hydrolase family 78 protein [Oscillospiraceae bacterium]
MRIYDMKTNRLTNPLGFTLDIPRASWKIDQAIGSRQGWARVRVAADPAMETIIYDAGADANLDSLCSPLPITLAPRTRYYWDVEVEDDRGDRARSEPVWFETGKVDEPWVAKWITAPAGSVEGSLTMARAFAPDRPVKSARIYATGVGLYELELNGSKVGDEFYAPFFNQYAKWIQAQTYDVTAQVRQGLNTLKAYLGNGWYMGRFGFRDGYRLCGDTQALKLELHIYYEDGTREIISTQPGEWTASDSPFSNDSIYDGETYDATFKPSVDAPAVEYVSAKLDAAILMDRLSPPVRAARRLKPASVFMTSAGETVLDLGQEITGYLEFNAAMPRGTKVQMNYFELTQDGRVFRDNLRTALQEYHYISDGSGGAVRPRFTFFGFRYVQLIGFVDPRPEDFTGVVIHSELKRTAWFESSSPKLNKFAENALWGQLGNFLDVPTDCPQRDERMGWTGDAQVFAGTACYQTDAAAFYDKYMYDMLMEQEIHGGAVPHTVPAVPYIGGASCGWADAGTVIPWTTYEFYGDKALLAKQYANMQAWVEWLYRHDEETGGKRLWHDGFHFGDWLAPDTKDGSPMGGTDEYFIASAYYYYSVSLVRKAALALGKHEDMFKYGQLLSEIGKAIRNEYFTPAGALAQTTQTGYILSLFMEFSPASARDKLAGLLRREFEKSKGKLRTGFIGTAYLCRALSASGLNDIAYSLLLSEEMPGWLYEVNMGATTVWERWNAILPDGRISDITMNSLNHYAYGAVMEWVFRDVCGLAPSEGGAGFRNALLAPKPDRRLPSASLRLESPIGLYVSDWTIEGNEFRWTVTVPFGGRGDVVFPGADAGELAAAYPDAGIVKRNDGLASAALKAGTYSFVYDAGRINGPGGR